MASIGDHAIIGGGGLAALVTGDGTIDWFCWPRLDGPALLCRLLDERQGGFLSVSPTFPGTLRRAYVPGTNVLETVFETEAGAVRVTDFVPWPRQPGDPTIVRRIEGLVGTPSVAVRFRPTPGFATEPATIECGQRLVEAHWSEGWCRLFAPAVFRQPDDRTAVSTLAIGAGDVRWVVLHCGTGERREAAPPSHEALEGLLARTSGAWAAWSARRAWNGFASPLVERSALLLELLTHRPSGGIIAAPTTSLPEDPGGVRNWDYRYTWLRDAALSVRALMQLGYHDEAMAYWPWVEDRGQGGSLQIMYCVDGGQVPAESEVSHLRGWRGSRPVRVGNDASRQRQHDVYGEVLRAAEFCQRVMGMERDHAFRRMVVRLADRVCAVWRDPDRGIWEIRGPRQHYLHSKLMSWVALDRAATIGRRLGLERTGAWAREAASVRRAILERGFDEQVGAFTQAFGSTTVDATALVVPLVGLLPPDDRRVRRSLETIRRELSTGSLLRRYRGDDGLPGSEGAFLLCSFWLVDNLVQQGRLAEAQRCFLEVADCANDVGLLAEEVDPSTGELLGNFPQALSHLGLIGSAVQIESALRGGQR